MDTQLNVFEVNDIRKIAWLNGDVAIPCSIIEFLGEKNGEQWYRIRQDHDGFTSPGGVPSSELIDVTTAADVRKMKNAEKAELIKAYMAPFFTPGKVVELRMLEVGGHSKRIDAGWFDNIESFAKAAAPYVGKAHIYFTPNDVSPDLMARAANRVAEWSKTTTSDADIVCRRWFLIDTDPVRPSGISATDAEHDAAIAVLMRIKDYLSQSGWPQPHSDDSGNGGHLEYAIDLPNDDESRDLLSNCLQALSSLFSDEKVSVDTTNFNAARIWKALGAISIKGDDIPTRPHRLAKPLVVPGAIEVVPVEKLQALAKHAPVQPSDTTDNNGKYTGKFNLEQWIKDNNIDACQKKPYKGGWIWDLNKCYFSSDHTDGAYIILNSDGKIAAGCKHNRCSNKTWHDLRAIYDGTKEERKEKWIKEQEAKRLAEKQKKDEALRQAVGLANGNGAKPASKQTNEAPDQPTQPRTVDQSTGEILPEVADDPIGFEQVIDAIQAIAQNADLKPEDRRKQIVGLADAIGAVAKAEQIEVSAAVAGANAGFNKTKADEFVKACASDVKKKRKEANRAKAQLKRQSAAQSTDRILIETGNRQLRELVADASSVLNDYNAENPTEPAAYINAGRVARVQRDENNSVGIAAYSKAGCKLLFSYLADYGKTSVNEETGEEKFYAEFPPDDLITSFLDMGDWPMCPPLDGIVNAPTFSKDGTLHVDSGYNSSTRLYNAGQVALGDIRPTEANVSAAKELIMVDLLGDFPFKDNASKAHAVAYTLLPFVRQVVQGQTPMTLVNSPTPGTGKTKLLVSCAYPALGSEIGLMNECEDEAEWVKTLTGTFLSGASHLVIDNVNNGLSSGKLAAAITSGMWNERLLGGNNKPTLKVRTIFAATGNNVMLTDEIARRCVMIDLDANVERPDKRTDFRHSLPTWAKENRDKLVTACITLVNAWIAKGKPRFTGVTKGSFEEWAQVMGGILQVVEIPGFLENEDALFEAAVSKNQAISEFVRAWFDKFGHNPVTSSELFKLASYSDNNDENRSGEWKDLLHDYLGAKAQQSRTTKLGNLLAQHKNKVVAGFKIVEEKPLNGYKQWALIDPKDATTHKQQMEHARTTTKVNLGHPSDPKFGEVEEPNFPPLNLVEPPAYVGSNGTEPEVITWTL